MKVRAAPFALAAFLASAHAQEGGWGGVPEVPHAARSAAGAPVAWGNVHGTVLDAWGKPAVGEKVTLDARGIDLATATDSVGHFLFSGIPLAGDRDSALVSVGDRAIWPPLRTALPPGAVLSPRLLFQPGTSTIVPAAPARGDIPEWIAAARSVATSAPWAGPWSIFATREGLVGFTTANGHVIQQGDRFVALPSRRGLNANDSSREFMVELANGDKRVRVPVMDIGPWNTRDDWWHDTLREQFRDLPRGTPQALAAFRDGHNGGLDERGRKVLNGAGIDLADGVFWNDLGLVNNGNIEVRLLWKLDAEAGDRVWLRQWANIRDSAGGKILFKARCGESGTVAGPPRGGLAGSKWYLYWPVAWDRGTAGWVVENYLDRDSMAVSCPDAVRRRDARNSRLRLDPRGAWLTASRSGRAELRRIAPDGRILSRMDVELASGENRVALPRATSLEFVHAFVEGAVLVGVRVP